MLGKVGGKTIKVYKKKTKLIVWNKVKTKLSC